MGRRMRILRFHVLRFLYELIRIVALSALVNVRRGDFIFLSVACRAGDALGDMAVRTELSLLGCLSETDETHSQEAA